ncbi:MAG: hypothetical protein V3V28_10485 [Polaribacter sp.]|uniref:hypothetical protein n=1 Tax=Polaribacter sp. TaxID=1920175 RepID=UPI002F35530E
MKTILLVVAMLGTLAKYASDKNTGTKLDSKKVRVEFKSVKKRQNITIKNVSGTKIYNKENEGNYSRLFNFSSLINGFIQ